MVKTVKPTKASAAKPLKTKTAAKPSVKKTVGKVVAALSAKSKKAAVKKRGSPSRAATKPFVKEGLVRPLKAKTVVAAIPAKAKSRSIAGFSLPKNAKVAFTVNSIAGQTSHKGRLVAAVKRGDSGRVEVVVEGGRSFRPWPSQVSPTA